MSINSYVDIKDGDYGEWRVSKAGKRYFQSHGTAIYLDEIFNNIDDGCTYVKLSTTYHDQKKTIVIKRGDLADASTAKVLLNQGFTVTKKHYDAFVDLILIQDEELEEENQHLTNAYTNLGWIELPDGNGGFKLCYRLDKIIGARNGYYCGSYDVAPMGNYKVWSEMVKNDVIGHSALEFVLVAALSAVINGLISPVTNGENSIVHLNYASGKGKTTGTNLAVSTAGCPFEGTIKRRDADGNVKTLCGLHQSWGTTDNAAIGSLVGNRGVVTVLNELGKNQSKNMTRLIFDMSEGSDKKRLTGDLNVRVSEGFTTTFISSGEESLIDKCTAKLEGLSVRVMEIKEPLTDDANHSNRIKEVCRKNNGFAARKLAQYIINNGGVNFVLPIYRKWQQTLLQSMPNTTNRARFVEKFAALFMATAEISTSALGIEFDIQGLQKFLLEYDEKNGNDRNVALKAYEKVVEQCRIDINNFYTDLNTNNPPKGKIYGRICICKNKRFQDKYVDEEFLIRGTYLEEVLKKYGFPNKDTCIRAWENARVLSRDKDRPTRSRQISPLGPKEDVYVLMTFKETKTKPKGISILKAQEKSKNLLTDN